MLNHSNWTKQGVGNAWEWNNVDSILALSGLGPLDTEQATRTGEFDILSSEIPVAVKC